MKKNKTIWLVIIGLCTAAFAVAAVMLIIHLLPDRPDQYSEYKLNPQVSSEPEVILPDNPIIFDELKATNPDICAWLTVPDTVIDYPVFQSSDTDEDFYLDHDINRNYKGAGSLYIQKMNFLDFSDPNTVIYGHNMLNGSMFGTLKKFRNRDYFDQHSVMHVYTPGHILTYTIYSAFLYDDRHILYSYNFYDDADYSDFIAQTLNPASMVKNVREGVAVTSSDRIITLSTCTNNGTSRYLVEGVLTNDQPTK